jgi:hypothetical protein
MNVSSICKFLSYCSFILLICCLLVAFVGIVLVLLGHGFVVFGIGGTGAFLFACCTTISSNVSQKLEEGEDIVLVIHHDLEIQ